MKRFLKTYFRTIIWLFIMFYLLFSPDSGLPKTSFLNIPHFDKFIHFSMFCLFIFLFFYETEKLNKNVGYYLIFFSGFLLFSALSEVIQYNFIAGRSGNIYDFLADVTGLFIGIILYRWVWKKIRVLQKTSN